MESSQWGKIFGARSAALTLERDTPGLLHRHDLLLLPQFIACYELQDTHPTMKANPPRHINTSPRISPPSTRP